MPPQKRAASSTGTGTAKHPAHRGGAFKTGTEVVEYLGAIQGHEARAANALREQAQRVYQQILKSGKMPGGIDRMVVARRQRRNFLRLATWLEGAAKQAAYCQASWHGDFMASKTRSGDLDPTK